MLLIHADIMYKKSPEIMVMVRLIRRTSQWASWRLKTPTTHLLFNRLFRLTSYKKNESLLLVLCEGNPSWSVDSPHKWSVTLKAVLFHDAIIRFSLWLGIERFYRITYRFMWHIYPYSSGLLHWHRDYHHEIVPVALKQHWIIFRIFCAL